MSNNYNSDSMVDLGKVEAIRIRPASIGIENQNHTFIEIVSNSIDEAKENFGNTIIITKHSDKSITVQDFGRGCPMDLKSTGGYAWQSAFDRLWSGGKYTNNKKERNYLFSLGTNGVGATGTNYTSDFFEVTVYRDGYKYYIRFEKGIVQGELLKEKCSYENTGTIIHWLPSKEVFGDNNIANEFILETLKQQAIINAGIKFVFIDENNNTSEYYYEKGITDYIGELNQGKNFTDIMQYEVEASGKEVEDSEEYQIKIQLAFCFNNEIKHLQYFHNSSWLQNGGTPERAIYLGFAYAVDKFLKDNNRYNKNEKRISFDDVMDSLIAISNSYSTIPLFTDQTKKTMQSKFMQKFMTEWIKEKLEIYFLENKLDAEKICTQVLINKRSREKSEQTRYEFRKKLQATMTNSLSTKVEGLKDCDMKTPLNDRELWLCEGLSACSTLTDARDGKTMGTYGLGGRFISSLKKSVEEVLDNKPAKGIIGALGCGIEIPKEDRKKVKGFETFDINNLRYGNIIIATDADFFGKGITLSLLTFFYKFMPTLLKQGRIYISVSPRFEITTKDKLLFAYNETERDKIIKELEKKGIKYIINIVKGLGEIDKEIFWDYVMNPETRILKQVIYSENEEQLIKQYFDTLMGDDIDNRKLFVKEKITNLELAYVD